MSTQNKGGGSTAGGKSGPAKPGGGKGGSKGAAATRADRVSERRAQVEAMRKAQARRERLRMSALITGTALVAVVVIVLAVVFSGGSGSSGAKASNASYQTGSDLLATTQNAVQGETVDGIKCDPNEQLVTHTHSHLAIYVNGQQKKIPYAIGIPNPVVQQSKDGPVAGASSCYYWLHTHDDSGIVHVEAPDKNAVYTLGQFFDEWKQPLSQGQIGPAKGAMTIEIDGKPYTGDPRKIPLKPHAVIQVSIGKVVPFKKYTFEGGL